MKTKQDWWKDTFSKTYFSLWDHGKTSSINGKKRKNNGLDFLSILKLKKQSKILDLACGPGRHSVFLAQKGFKVTGVDYSVSALNIAKKNSKLNDVQIDFLKKDMRFFDLKKKFDAVFLLGNSFGYFSDKDNEKVIKQVSKHLIKNGYFIIHTVNPMQILSFDEKSDVYEYEIPGGKLKMKLIYFDPITFIRKSYWEIIKGKNKKRMDVSMRLYTMPEINLMLSKNKLEIVEIFGSLNLKPYTVKSPALIIIAKKK